MRKRFLFAFLFAGLLLPACTAPQGAAPEMGQRSRRPSLKITETAPTFKLASLETKRKVDLASYKGDRPVLLFFGSYT